MRASLHLHTIQGERLIVFRWCRRPVFLRVSLRRLLFSLSHSDLHSFFHADSAKENIRCAFAHWGVLPPDDIPSSHFFELCEFQCPGCNSFTEILIIWSTRRVLQQPRRRIATMLQSLANLDLSRRWFCVVSPDGPWCCKSLTRTHATLLRGLLPCWSLRSITSNGDSRRTWISHSTDRDTLQLPSASNWSRRFWLAWIHRLLRLTPRPLHSHLLTHHFTTANSVPILHLWRQRWNSKMCLLQKCPLLFISKPCCAADVVETENAVPRERLSERIVDTPVAPAEEQTVFQVTYSALTPVIEYVTPLLLVEFIEPAPEPSVTHCKCSEQFSPFPQETAEVVQVMLHERLQQRTDVLAIEHKDSTISDLRPVNSFLRCLKRQLMWCKSDLATCRVSPMVSATWSPSTSQCLECRLTKWSEERLSRWAPRDSWGCAVQWRSCCWILPVTCSWASCWRAQPPGALSREDQVGPTAFCWTEHQRIHGCGHFTHAKCGSQRGSRRRTYIDCGNKPRLGPTCFQTETSSQPTCQTWSSPQRWCRLIPPSRNISDT